MRLRTALALALLLVAGVTTAGCGEGPDGNAYHRAHGSDGVAGIVPNAEGAPAPGPVTDDPDDPSSG